MLLNRREFLLTVAALAVSGTSADAAAAIPHGRRLFGVRQWEGMGSDVGRIVAAGPTYFVWLRGDDAVEAMWSGDSGPRPARAGDLRPGCALMRRRVQDGDAHHPDDAWVVCTVDGAGPSPGSDVPPWRPSETRSDFPADPAP